MVLFAIIPVSSPSILLCSQLVNGGEVRVEVIMHIKSIRETGVIVKKHTLFANTDLQQLDTVRE